MINDNPLEEGVDNQRTQEDFIFEELAALNEARKTLFDDSTTDYTNDYNTENNPYYNTHINPTLSRDILISNRKIFLQLSPYVKFCYK